MFSRNGFSDEAFPFEREMERFELDPEGGLDAHRFETEWQEPQAEVFRRGMGRSRGRPRAGFGRRAGPRGSISRRAPGGVRVSGGRAGFGRGRGVRGQPAQRRGGSGRAFPGRRIKLPYRPWRYGVRGYPFATVIRDRGVPEPAGDGAPSGGSLPGASGAGPAGGMDMAPAEQPSERVRWLQSALNQVLGLNLPLDGVMGVETRSALRSFQEKNGLPVDGIAGPDTERALMAARAGGSKAPGQEPAAGDGPSGANVGAGDGAGNVAGNGASASAAGANGEPAVESESFLGSLFERLLPGRIIDRTHLSPREYRLGKPRDLSKVYALVLHQMAFSRGSDPNRYNKVKSHYAILPDGKILQLHPDSALLAASNGFNTGSVAVEFAGNFPNTKGKCWQAAKYGCHKLTPAQVEAGRYLVQHLIKKIRLTHILAHRQSSASRENDPGPDIWSQVGQWAIRTHGLKDGGANFSVGGGKPILDAWRTWGQGSSSPELEVYGQPVPSNRSSAEYVRWVQSTLNRVMGLSLAVDGILGAQTRSAVRSFQQRQGLAVDGVVGPQTEAALKAASASGAYGSPSTGGATGSSTSCTRAVLDQFGFNQDGLSASHRSTIDRLAACILTSQSGGSPIQSVRLVGHTDPVGTVAYNETLGRRRAEQVRAALRSRLDALRAGLGGQVSYVVESRGEKQPISPDPARNRRVELTLTAVSKVQPLGPLSTKEKAEYDRLGSAAKRQFDELRAIVGGYSGVARREGDRGSRVLLQRGVFRSLPDLLPELLKLARVASLPSGWSLGAARPLLVGNVLYNLSFPETINQGGKDRLGGKGDPTCFSASTQILLARRFPVTYVRYLNQLAATRKVTFAGGASTGTLTFKSTSLYKSLDSVLLQTAFDTYFNNSFTGGSYTPGDELKVHRQVFGAGRPPAKATWGTTATLRAAFRKAFVTGGGNVRPPESVNLCVGPHPCGSFNHTVVLTRIANGRVYFYNPWPNEKERDTMFGPGKVTVSGNGERPAESSMTQADFENQLTTVFHN